MTRPERLEIERHIETLVDLRDAAWDSGSRAERASAPHGMAQRYEALDYAVRVARLVLEGRLSVG